MPDADCTMMRRSLRVPRFHESLCTDGKTVVAVRVADAEDLTGYAFTLRRDEFESTSAIFGNREQSHRSMLDAHLDGETSANFAVIDRERPHLRPAFGNGDVAGSIMSHQHSVGLQIESIVFSERAARTKAIHDLHGQDILYFVLTGYWNAPCRQQ